MSQRSFIRHIVFFSAAYKADIPRIIEGLSILKDIPHPILGDVWLWPWPAKLTSELTLN